VKNPKRQYEPMQSEIYRRMKTVMDAEEAVLRSIDCTV